MIKPHLNVTPLIDILLVLLIIFMVISPLKPSSFKTKIPAEPESDSREIHPNGETLVVSLDSESNISLNHLDGFGSAADAHQLTEKLQNVFAARKINGVSAQNQNLSAEFGSTDGIEKTVFIKAPKKFEYGKVVKVIDAVKLSGASPISLQIDDLR